VSSDGGLRKELRFSDLPQAPLPEPGSGPILSVAPLDAEHEAVLAGSVGIAPQVVLNTLTPPERVAFVLHDLFSVPFDDIAEGPAPLDQSPVPWPWLSVRRSARGPAGRPAWPWSTEPQGRSSSKARRCSQ
jgi:hypothetical protein